MIASHVSPKKSMWFSGSGSIDGVLSLGGGAAYVDQRLLVHGGSVERSGQATFVDSISEAESAYDWAVFASTHAHTLSSQLKLDSGDSSFRVAAVRRGSEGKVAQWGKNVRSEGEEYKFSLDGVAAFVESRTGRTVFNLHYGDGVAVQKRAVGAMPTTSELDMLGGAASATAGCYLPDSALRNPEHTKLDIIFAQDHQAHSYTLMVRLQDMTDDTFNGRVMPSAPLTKPSGVTKLKGHHQWQLCARLSGLQMPKEEVAVAFGSVGPSTRKRPHEDQVYAVEVFTDPNGSGHSKAVEQMEQERLAHEAEVSPSPAFLATGALKQAQQLQFAGEQLELPSNLDAETAARLRGILASADRRLAVTVGAVDELYHRATAGCRAFCTDESGGHVEVLGHDENLVSVVLWAASGALLAGLLIGYVVGRQSGSAPAMSMPSLKGAPNSPGSGAESPARSSRASSAEDPVSSLRVAVPTSPNGSPLLTSPSPKWGPRQSPPGISLSSPEPRRSNRPATLSFSVMDGASTPAPTPQRSAVPASPGLFGSPRPNPSSSRPKPNV